MTRDLVEVVQRGVAIIHQDTPSDIAGFYTQGVETCIAVFLSGNDDHNHQKYALMHVDNQTTSESIDNFISSNFEQLQRCQFFVRPAMNDVAAKIIAQNQHTLNSCFSLRDIEKIFHQTLENGSLLVEINEARSDVTFHTHCDPLSLENRRCGDRLLLNSRKIIHELNTIFGNQGKNGDAFNIDFQFDGASHRPLPQIADQRLVEDLSKLSHKVNSKESSNQKKEEIFDFAVSSLEKYPHFFRAVVCNKEFLLTGATAVESYLQNVLSVNRSEQKPTKPQKAEGLAASFAANMKKKQARSEKPSEAKAEETTLTTDDAKESKPPKSTTARKRNPYAKAFDGYSDQRIK